MGTQSLSTTASDEVFGAYNSILDQAYGEDDITGKNWGYIGTTNEAAYSDGGCLKLWMPGLRAFGLLRIP